jgi:hypothetical protein
VRSQADRGETWSVDRWGGNLGSDVLDFCTEVDVRWAVERGERDSEVVKEEGRIV